MLAEILFGVYCAEVVDPVDLTWNLLPRQPLYSTRTKRGKQLNVYQGNFKYFKDGLVWPSMSKNPAILPTMKKIERSTKTPLEIPT